MSTEVPELGDLFHFCILRRQLCWRGYVVCATSCIKSLARLEERDTDQCDQHQGRLHNQGSDLYLTLGSRTCCWYKNVNGRSVTTEKMEINGCMTSSLIIRSLTMDSSTVIHLGENVLNNPPLRVKISDWQPSSSAQITLTISYWLGLLWFCIDCLILVYQRQLYWHSY